MNLLNLVGITVAYAANAPNTSPNPWSMLWFPILIFVALYFLLIRPQTKRAKAHRQLIDKIAVNDEVITSGGVIGKIFELKDKFIVLELPPNKLKITVQKNSITSVLPRNTVDSL